MKALLLLLSILILFFIVFIKFYDDDVDSGKNEPRWPLN